MYFFVNFYWLLEIKYIIINKNSLKLNIRTGIIRLFLSHLKLDGDINNILNL